MIREFVTRDALSAGMNDHAGVNLADPKIGCRRLSANALGFHELGDLGDLLRSALQPKTPLPGLQNVISGKAVSERRLNAELSAAHKSALEKIGLVDYRSGIASSPLRANLVDDFVVISDPDVPELDQYHLYLDPLWEAPWLARCTLRGRASSGLDMGCGCGVLSLVLASFCEKVIAVDVNPRALEFARFNAALNRITNISFISSDLFEGLSGKQFDRIVFNSPTGEEEQRSISLLEAGEGILARFFGALEKHLTATGYCQVNLAMNDYAHSSFYGRLKTWVGDAYQKMQWLTLISETVRRTSFHAWRRGWMTVRRGGHLYDEVDWAYPALYPEVPPADVTSLILRILENEERLSRESLHHGDRLAWVPGVTRKDSQLCLWGIPVLAINSAPGYQSFEGIIEIGKGSVHPWLLECLRCGLMSLNNSHGNRG